LLAAVLLGNALRLHELEAQSLWSDEGLSLYRSALSLPEVLANTITIDGVDTRDATPPFYFLLLWAFRAVAGETVFALRFASVAVSTLAIPLIYLLGSLTLGRRVGLIAAIFLAISPFHIWQSQVLRNYGILITLNLLSIYGLYRYLLAKAGRRRPIWLALWLGASLIGIYTHFFALFVFAYSLLALVLTLASEKGIDRLLRKVWFWVGAGAALLIVLPAIAWAANRFMAGRQIDFAFVPLARFLLQTISALGVGVNWSLTHPFWRTLPVLMIAIAGLWFAWRYRRKPAVLLVGYQLVPLGLLYGLSYVNPIYNGVRHLLIGLPPFIIFVASGIVGPFQSSRAEGSQRKLRQVWRVVGPVAAVVMLAIQLNWLYNQFNAPELVRDDVRGPALYLNEHATAQDVVVLHDTIIRPTFEYYYDGAAPVVSVPLLDELNVQATVERLGQIGIDAERIWFLTEPAPRTGFDRRVLSDWAEASWLQLFEQRYPSMWLRVNLVGYHSGVALDDLPDAAKPANVSWDQALTLHGFAVPESVTAGGDLWTTLYLSQPKSYPEQYMLSLRLVDAQGQDWAHMDKQIPAGFPPMIGEADTLKRYDHQTIVPPGLPPGRYTLTARLIRTADSQTVPLSTGEVEYRLADINVGTASCSQGVGDLPADRLLTKNFQQGIQLAGHDRPPAQVRAGLPIQAPVWWCADGQPEDDYRLRLQLVDSADQVLAESIGPLVTDDYPTSQWQEGALLMGRPALTIPANVEAGLYDIRLSLLQPDRDRPVRIGWPLGEQSLSLGQIEVTSWPLQTELPAISHPLRAEFGQPTAIEFHGFDLESKTTPANESSQADELKLTLVWRSVASEHPINYKVFVHLVDEDGAIVAQSDAYPVGRFRPTTSWRSGEVITDEHTLSVPVGGEAGEYTLWVGLYDPATVQRLAIYVDGQQQPDERLRLTTLSAGP
jgi:4-amino-4-deoxy-L-arabinose transferase-like glycosyltransferase